MSETTDDPIDAAVHRRLAVDLFNRSWQLIGLESRTAAQDDELLHCAHASRHHWGEVGTAAHSARGEGQCARAYATLGRAEPALHHARRALDLVEAGGEGFEEWDLASAFEIVARAHLVAGDGVEAKRHAGLAREALVAISDPEDREVIASQVAELGV